jgi:hypothetical protein
VDFTGFLRRLNESPDSSLASGIGSLAVLAIFMYRKLYRRGFKFLFAYILCSFMLSAGQIWLSKNGDINALNEVGEIILGALVLASLLENCWFQLSWIPFRVALWCVATGAFCWWGAHQVRSRTTLTDIHSYPFWLPLALNCLTIGLLLLFISLRVRQVLPIVRPLYVELVTVTMGLGACITAAGLVFDIFNKPLQAAPHTLSSGGRLFALGALLTTFIFKEPPWKPAPPEAIARMAQHLDAAG